MLNVPCNSRGEVNLYVFLTVIDLYKVVYTNCEAKSHSSLNLYFEIYNLLLQFKLQTLYMLL